MLNEVSHNALRVAFVETIVTKDVCLREQGLPERLDFRSGYRLRALCYTENPQ